MAQHYKNQPPPRVTGEGNGHPGVGPREDGYPHQVADKARQAEVQALVAAAREQAVKNMAAAWDEPVEEVREMQRASRRMEASARRMRALDRARRIDAGIVGSKRSVSRDSTVRDAPQFTECQGCGGPLHTLARYGFCSRNDACKRRAVNASRKASER